MLRILVRFFGVMFLAAGFAALVVDGTKSIASNMLVLTPLREIVRQLAPSEIQSSAAAAGDKLATWAWDPATTAVMAMPIWLIVGGAGMLLVLSTRRRLPQIGYSSR